MDTYLYVCAPDGYWHAMRRNGSPDQLVSLCDLFNISQDSLDRNECVSFTTPVMPAVPAKVKMCFHCVMQAP